MRSPCLSIALLVLLPACNQGGKPAANGGVPVGTPGARPQVARPFVGKLPPELMAASTARWLNTERPLTLAGLLGRVVWLEFSFIH